MGIAYLNRLKNWQLVSLSVILLSLAWPPLPTFFLLFTAFVPLLILTNRLANKGDLLKFLFWIFTSILLWNIFTTWWVSKASFSGAIAMLITNTLYMSLPWICYRFAIKQIGAQKALYLWVCFYLGMEFFHHQWDLSWPWLTLGNALASANIFAQFYEFTGTAGGSLWILLVNVLLYNSSIKGFSKPLIAAALIVPIILSFILYFLPAKKSVAKVTVGLVQPNFEPHEEKFNVHPMVQLDTMITQMDDLYLAGARLFILPETALVDHITEEYAEQNQKIIQLKNWVVLHKDAGIIAGCETLIEYDKKATSTARNYLNDESIFYDAFNSAIYLDSNGLQPFYHKSKLVPGTEIMPYPGFFAFLGKYAIALGGTSGSLARDYKVINYKLNNGVLFAPSICYESIYGEWTAAFVNQGAGFIAIISNDGWWGNTVGHEQLLQYGALRAIETRRWIARSGNTGISAIIDAKGRILAQTTFWKRTTLLGEINILKGQTIYMLIGDVIGKIAFIISLLVMPSLMIKSFLRKKLS